MTEAIAVQVHVPTPLRSYTHANIVAANGTTLADVIADLDHRYPGLRFRMINEQGDLREHLKIFINQTIAPDLHTALQTNDHVYIITAISGG